MVSLKPKQPMKAQLKEQYRERSTSDATISKEKRPAKTVTNTMSNNYGPCENVIVYGHRGTYTGPLNERGEAHGEGTFVTNEMDKTLNDKTMVNGMPWEVLKPYFMPFEPIGISNASWKNINAAFLVYQMDSTNPDNNLL